MTSLDDKKQNIGVPSGNLTQFNIAMETHHVKYIQMYTGKFT